MTKKYIGIVIEGIEDIAAEEVRGKIKEKRRIIFEKLLKNYTTIDTVYELEEEYIFTDQENLIERIQKKKWAIKDPFRVTCKREGSHLFTANDIEKEVGAVIYNQGHKVSLKEPKTTIFVDIQDNKCALGTLIQEDAEKRAYRVRRNNTGISASLAAAVIRSAKVAPEETIFDPYCKDGVVAIEAINLGSKQVYANDLNENNLRNAQINAKMAKVNIAWEVPTTVDYIITNLWVPAKAEESKEYAIRFLEASKEKVKKKLILITNWKGLEKRIPDAWLLEEKRIIKRGEVSNYVFYLKRSG